MFIVMRDGASAEYDDLNEVLRLAQSDDPVYVDARGWMLVGDLRWNMMAGGTDRRPPHIDDWPDALLILQRSAVSDSPPFAPDLAFS